MALILCLFNSGVNFWKYSSDGRRIAVGGEVFDVVEADDVLGFSFFGFAA